MEEAQSRRHVSRHEFGSSKVSGNDRQGVKIGSLEQQFMTALVLLMCTNVGDDVVSLANK